MAGFPFFFSFGWLQQVREEQKHAGKKKEEKGENISYPYPILLF
ncbi:hypothetical protein SLEP1_g33945 [Rubroshorea leprosula]|uniref:Uncharacterized protein n=1 Tax=Rubroshorea leprosula TaxID=152421 RepID=A0AAV5KI85_9ROSI|nr:hypothetical protein SLEP1_g33945 [Rubroshorea leprosula]